MTQNANGDFVAATGEIATVTVTAVQCNHLTSGSYDGSPKAQKSRNPDVYAFTVTGASGDEHTFACSCAFQSADPIGAEYDVTVSGSLGGNFAPIKVGKVVPEQSFTLNFIVE
jgi:hypothetical protein